MRIGVIGAGAIGGTIAALLERGGHDVEVTARGPATQAIRQGGLRLDGAWGTHVARVRASETLSAQPELAFVCTKALDAASAIEDNRAALTGITVVIVQNGLAGLAPAQNLLADSDCVGALALYASSLVAPGQVTVTAAANTYLGSGAGAPSEAATRVAAVLNAVMPSHAVANFSGCQWTKLIVNQINALPAITGLSTQQTLGDPALRHIITLSMREAARTGFASGIRFGSIQGLNNAIVRLLAAAPAWFGQVVPLLIRRHLGTTPNPGSTLQSIRRGQPTEIDYLNGAIVDEAGRIGRQAPINAELVRLVHRVESSGSFISPDVVVSALKPLISSRRSRR